MDDVQICNMALGHLRATSIESLSENSLEAEYCRLYYDTARLAALEGFDWNFARRKLPLQQIAQYSDTNEYGYLFRYGYPSDCAKARYIPRAGTQGYQNHGHSYQTRTNQFYNQRTQQAIPAPFELALAVDASARNILTDEENACLIYTMDLQNVNLMPQEFIIAFSYMLAALLAVPVGKGGETAYKRCMESYRLSLPEVKANSANEEDNVNPVEMGEFEAARF